MLGTEGKTRVLQTWNANSFSNIAYCCPLKQIIAV